MITTYDPRQVRAIVNAIDVTPWAASNFIEIGTSQLWRQVVGTDGEVIRVRSASFQGTISITLLQNAPILRILGASSIADLLLGVGAGPLLIHDLDGPWDWSAPASYLSEWPRQGFSNETQALTWTFQCPHLDALMH